MTLYFEETGPDNAESIIFLHGGGAGGWMWKKTIQNLKDFHCLVPDLPEHDRSVEIKPFTISAAALAATDLIHQHAHGKKAHVVGLSLGAQVGVQMLKDSAAAMRSAFLSSPIMKPLFGAGLGFYNENVMRWSHRLFMQPLKNWNWWIKLNMKYSAGIPDEYFTDFKRVFQTMSEDAFAHIITEGMKFRMPSGLEKINTRVMVTAGNNEYGVMKDSIKMLAQTLPNAQAFLVNLGSQHRLAESHNWALSAPELFADSLRAWINGSPLPSELEGIN